MAILSQKENCVSVPDLCRQHVMGIEIFYKWRAKFRGMDALMIKRLKKLEDEGRRFKKMYAEERQTAGVRQEALQGKL